MPTYCHICTTCGKTKEVTRPMKNSGMIELCDCGKMMVRDLRTEHSNVRGDYNHPITSVSMAFNSQDVAEHRRRHPGVDLHVDKAGGTAYPILRGRSQKLQYLRARGWQEK